ncbi:MAG TPA: hypothetical protein VIZ68_07040, partial [Thermoplasmata archaeon]
MSVLGVDDTVTLVEILVILLGVAITWAVYHGSDRAELPGDALVPDPTIPDESALHRRDAQVPGAGARPSHAGARAGGVSRPRPRR